MKCVLIALGCALIVPLAQAGPPPAYLVDGAIRTAGAEHGDILVDGFNRLYVAAHPGVRFGLPVSGTTSAMPWLTYGRVLFALMGRTATPQELAAFEAENGVPPLEIRIAHTSDNPTEDLSYSLGIYVNRANPIDALSPGQVARMLSAGNPGGDYSRWGQLGLTGEWAARAIHPYGTPEYTGMGVYMQSTHLGSRPFAANYEAHGSTPDILKRLADDPAGIAFAAINRGNAQLKQVGILTESSASALIGTRDEVAAGRYPYGRYVYMYVRRTRNQPIDPVAAAYLRTVLSTEGQALIETQPRGYIPLNAQERLDELEKLK
ncbi:PBP superfamily domain protein [Caballeronia sordidicola]|uniref:PBP superfamily domain protein n=1 Tax=Caballeronia sordidicola TaxID=196367 RepID=A0A158G622_CABSO|nr:substrate-binding domain-containing protein [Caballeronia sordidicola]SAL27506.1 PBP superfamily domain protein [Caballeronia sordidicola]